MEKPLVSITSACYKASEDVLAMIRSILAQSFKDWELVLLEDCSPDDTYSLISSVSDPRIKVYRNKKNLGIPASLNRLTELSVGKYIARMDSDDLSAVDRIRKQVDFMESNPDVDVLGTGVIYLDSNNQPLGKSPLITTHDEICKNAAQGIGVSHPTIMGKKTWFQKFKYNEKIPRTSDLNLLLHAHEKSVYANLNEHLFYYRLGLSFSLTKEFKSRHYFWKTIADYYWPQKKNIVFRAIFMTYLKYVYELACCLFGQTKKAYRHRYLLLSPSEVHFHNEMINNIFNFPLPFSGKIDVSGNRILQNR